MISPYLCTDSHRDISISLVAVYSAETRPIGEIGCDDCISNLDTVDLLRSDGPMPIVPRGWPGHPLPLRSCGLRGDSPVCNIYSTKPKSGRRYRKRMSRPWPLTTLPITNRIFDISGIGSNDVVANNKHPAAKHHNIEFIFVIW